MSDAQKVLVVSYQSMDSQKLIGVTTSTEAAILLFSNDFMKNMDHETFEILTEDEYTTVDDEGGVLTTSYPIIEHGDDPGNSDECYQVQETWLFS